MSPVFLYVDALFHFLMFNFRLICVVKFLFCVFFIVDLRCSHGL